MAQQQQQQAQDIPLKGLLVDQADQEEADNQQPASVKVQQQDMDSSATSPMRRKGGSRSPLRARAHQSSDNVATIVNCTELLKSSPCSSLAVDHHAAFVHSDLLQNHIVQQMKKKESEGSATTPRAPHSSYTNPTFISKPTTPGDNRASTPRAPDRSHHCTDRDWERIVASGKEANDGTNLIRLLADFIEDFEFGSSGNEDYASWLNDSKSLPVESRHSHQLAGQLRRLADAFEKENTCYPLRERRIK